MVLEIRDLSVKVPGRRLLDGVSLSLSASECMAVVGPSGSGKTSFLNCVAGMTRPNSGAALVNGTELSDLSAARRAAFRLTKIGLVFQFGELLPELTAVENVALPSRLMGVAKEAAKNRAEAWLERFGLAEHAKSHPDSLSGGEQQRVGLARALAHEPILVLADEPTGMLDEANSRIVAELLMTTAREQGTAILLATHDSAVASAADRIVRIHDGSLVPDLVGG